MINKNDAEAIKGILLGFHNAFGVASRGLCLHWKEEAALTLVSYCSHHTICGDVGFGNGMWRFVGVMDGKNRRKSIKLGISFAIFVRVLHFLSF